MDIQSILVEFKHCNGNSVFGNSGIMYKNRYVFTTFGSIVNFFSNSDLEKIDPGRAKFLISDFQILQDILISVHAKDEGSNKISSYSAHFENLFQSSNIKASQELIFRNWSFESVNNQNTDLILSLIVVLKIEGAENNFQEDVQSWLNEMPNTMLSKGQKLKSVSTAFGNKQFMNHYSQGIVSNVLGENRCLIFSDMPLTPGGEGSPVFIEHENSRQVAIGMVISSINWWKGESLNFSVIVDLRSLFSEVLLQNSLYTINEKVDSNIALLSTLESSLFQIYNGFIWGTAIVIDREKGILMTNSHVMESSSKHPVLHQRNRAIPCDVIFSCDVDHPIDIAILKAREPLEKYSRTIVYAEKKVRCGDTVYAAGFPLFSRETSPGPTLTKGHVSHVHPHMIKTTCSIHPGASGGAILNENGDLVAVIVCNAKTSAPINMIYPRLNMNIPAKLLESILTEYIATEGDRYSDILTQIIEPLVQNHNDLWYQQDAPSCCAPPPHNSLNVSNILYRLFEDRWLANNGPHLWPPCSPDLTPLDYYVWGRIKNIVYSTPLTDKEDCIERVRNAFRYFSFTEAVRNKSYNLELLIKALIFRGNCWESQGVIISPKEVFYE